MFIRDNFQFNRGVPNCQATGEGLTSVQHTYRSATDSVADISGLDYFPDNFHEDIDFVIPKDTILIIGADAIIMVEVLTTAPVTLGVNLFTDSGPSLEIDPPIAATDANGIVLNGQVLTLEYADYLNPGIMSTTTQIMRGDKTFAGNMAIRALNSDFFGTPATQGLQIRETAATCGVDILNTNTSSVMGYTFGSIALGAAYAGMKFSATVFGGAPKLAFTIAGSTAMSIGTNLVVAFVGGITLPSAEGSASLLDYYQSGSYVTTLSNDTSTSNSITFRFVRVGDQVNIVLEGSPGVATTSATPGALYVSDTALPAQLLPFAATGGQIQITVAGVSKITSWGTNGVGQLYIGFDGDNSLDYPASTAITFGPGSLTYIQAA